MLSTSERDALLFMREEEKLARDVYLTLYSLWRLPVFSNIAASEQWHTDQVKRLLQNYGLPDPVTDERVGVFTNPELSGLYSTLVARGRNSLMDALQVGAFIEETDIADLHQAIRETSRPDIAAKYRNLMRGSHNHLRAFTGQITSRGVDYAAQALPQNEVVAIRGGSAIPANVSDFRRPSGMHKGNAHRHNAGRMSNNIMTTPRGRGQTNVDGGNRQTVGVSVPQQVQRFGGMGCGGGRRHQGGR